MLPRFSLKKLRLILILNLFFIVLFYIPNSLITPYTIGYPVFVMLNTMSSYVYRNMRLGSYKDYTITFSVINKAFRKRNQVSHWQHHDLVFEHQSTKRIEGASDLEAGDLMDTELKVDQHVEEGLSESRAEGVDV